MKTGDLVTRLILDDSKFYKNLKGAKDELDMFKAAGSRITGMLGKMTGALGLAVGGYELFDTAINSNMAIQNKFNDTVTTAKISINSFFSALQNGNWKVFEDGIGRAILLSRQYSVAVRQMKNNLMIGDVRMSQYEKELSKYENMANDVTLSPQEREQAFVAFKQQAKEAQEYMKGLSSSTSLNLKLMMEGKGIDTEDARKMILDYLDTSTAKGKLLLEYDSIEESIKSNNAKRTAIVATGDIYGMEAKGKAQEAYDTALKKKEELLKKDKALSQAYQLRTTFNNQEIMDALDYSDKIIGLEDRFNSLTTQVQGLSTEFDKNGKLIDENAGKIKNLPKPDTKLEAPKAVDDKELLDNLQERMLGYQVEIPTSLSLFWTMTLEEIRNKKNDLIKKLNNVKSHDEYVEIDADIKYLEKREKIITEDVTPLDVKELKKINSEANILTENINKWSGVASVAGAFEQLAGSIGSVAEQSKAMAASMVGVSTAASIAMMIATMVEKSKSSLTIWDWIAGITAGVATTVAMAAQLRSISTYATGGIVGGNKYTGDLNLVRVNSGEMILNSSQQRRLFQILNGTTATTSAMPNGKVQFIIKGKELVGVLRNYNNKINKVL